MANVEEMQCGSMLFRQEELQEMSGVNVGGGYVEVMCGCTSHRYGDAIAKLRVFPNGNLEITCECTPGCDEGLSLFCSLSLSLQSVSPVFLMLLAKWVLIYVHVTCECVCEMSTI